jgi:hypothetical protein
MVVHNLNLLGARLSPDKTNTPLVVNPNAMLPRPAALQHFQAVARRRHKVTEFAGLMDLPKLSLRNALYVLCEPLREPAMKKGFCVTVRERADHMFNMSVLRSERKAFMATSEVSKPDKSSGFGHPSVMRRG